MNGTAMLILAAIAVVCAIVDIVTGGDRKD